MAWYSFSYMPKTLKRRQFFLAVVDVILMYVSLVLALILRHGTSLTADYIFLHLTHFVPVFAIWLVTFYVLGLYRLDRTFDTNNYLVLFVVAFLTAGLLSVVYFYIKPEVVIAPKLLLVIFATVYAVLLWFWRYFYQKLWIQTRGNRIGVGFVGFSKEVSDIIQELGRHKLLGYDARFIFARSPTHAPTAIATASKDEGIVMVQDIDKIRQTVTNANVNVVVIATRRTQLSPDLLRELYGLMDLRVRFMRLPDFYEMIFRRVPIHAINESWFLENIDLQASVPYETIKSIADRILALVLSLISVPFFPFIALGIKLESKGPVFFKQERVGRNGVPFTMIKYRTMREDGNDFSPTQKDDGRITKFGAFLRATRIDEIPQVINILRGEMSFIGPRPERPDIADQLARAIPYYQQRHLLKPGVTGWDQVCGEYHSPSISDTQIKLQYDLYYLKHISFTLDVSILSKTIMTVARRRGR